MQKGDIIAEEDSLTQGDRMSEGDRNNLIGFGIFALVCAMVFLLVFKAEDKLEYKVRINGVEAVAYANFERRLFEKPAGNKLPLLFDGQENTGLALKNGIKIKFVKPVYLKAVDITAEKKVKPGKVTYTADEGIKVTAGMDDSFIGGNLKCDVEDGKKSYKIRDNDRYLRMLVTESVDIDCGNLTIDEISASYLKAPEYVGTMKLSAIEKKYVRGEEEWTMDTDKESKAWEKTTEEVELNLLSLALKGSKRAEKLLKNYYSSHTSRSEAINELLAWYEATKEAGSR